MAAGDLAMVVREVCWGKPEASREAQGMVEGRMAVEAVTKATEGVAKLAVRRARKVEQLVRAAAAEEVTGTGQMVAAMMASASMAKAAVVLLGEVGVADVMVAEMAVTVLGEGWNTPCIHRIVGRCNTATAHYDLHTTRRTEGG